MRQANSVKRVPKLGASIAVAVVALSALPAGAELIGYWKLDETTGTTASDSSGNARNGTLLDGAAWDAAGRLDGAIGLDGLNDRIHVPYHVDLTYTGGNLTLSTWAYIDSGETSGSLISKPWNWNGRYNYRLYVEGTRVGFRLGNANYPGDPRDVTILSPSYSNLAGAWHHVAGVVDNSNNMSLYVDGVLATTGANTITDWTGTNSSLPLALGTLFPYPAPWAGVASHALDGKLDDVAIWNDALDPTKIKSIYNVPTALGLSYDLDDMLELWSIFDTGPSGFGIVKGMPWWYTDELPGTPADPGGAYTYDDIMYVVLGSGVGLRTPEPSSLSMALLGLVLLAIRRRRHPR